MEEKTRRQLWYFHFQHNFVSLFFVSSSKKLFSLRLISWALFFLLDCVWCECGKSIITACASFAFPVHIHAEEPSAEKWEEGCAIWALNNVRCTHISYSLRSRAAARAKEISFASEIYNIVITQFSEPHIFPSFSSIVSTTESGLSARQWERSLSRLLFLCECSSPMVEAREKAKKKFVCAAGMMILIFLSFRDDVLCKYIYLEHNNDNNNSKKCETEAPEGEIQIFHIFSSFYFQSLHLLRHSIGEAFSELGVWILFSEMRIIGWKVEKFYRACLLSSLTLLTCDLLLSGVVDK